MGGVGFSFVSVLRLFVVSMQETLSVFHLSKLLASVSLLSFSIIWFSSCVCVCARAAKHENRFYYATPAMRVNSLNEMLLDPFAWCFNYKN